LNAEIHISKGINIIIPDFSSPNQYAKQNFHFDIFIFENKVDGQKLQLDEQFA
jgi:hypothetical protein